VPPQFGLSTRIVHDLALDAGHISLFARHGFTTIELAATRTHLDYGKDEALRALGTWLDHAGVRLHAVRAPRSDGVRGGGADPTWVAPFSLSSDDPAERRHALDETRLALAIARTLPFDVLTVHLERPRGTDAPADESLAAARRSLDELVTAADEAGVRLALVSGGGSLSRPETLVRIIERDLESTRVGICLDFGQAQLQGGVADAIEEAGEHMIAACLHDNHGRKDERLMPLSGAINWDAAMMGTQKIGYDGVLLFDVDGGGHLDATLQRAARARERLQAMLTPF
jgi:sugar phosphate isomerase/epimerase